MNRKYIVIVTEFRFPEMPRCFKRKVFNDLGNAKKCAVKSVRKHAKNVVVDNWGARAGEIGGNYFRAVIY